MNEPMPTLVPDTNYSTPDDQMTTGNPAAVEAAAPARDVRGGAKLYGFCSIETFCDQGGLSLTHDDAQGFYDYVNQFSAPNFWYQDANVKPWLYYEQYDNWQDTYGTDAVRAFYHSGHGGMAADGTFFLPMGADWGGLGCTAFSSQMRLGNEFLRYLFWSTCLSLRVTAPHSPIRTWNVANLGVRMIFGYETVSYDNANYGRFFWEEWNKNKSFSQAYLDASWRIAHNQIASVTACGANQAEAQNRLNGERLFYGDAVSRAYWSWRWQGNASAQRDALTTAPAQLQHATLGAAPLSAQALFDRFEMGGEVGARGEALVRQGARSLARTPDGAFAAQLRAPNLANLTPPPLATARAAADRVIDRLALSDGMPLVLDRVAHARAAGGTAEGSGRMEDPRVTETVLQYRQMIDGVPVISPDGGTLRVAVDNDGNPTRMDGNLRSVRDVSAAGRRTPPDAPQPDAPRGATAGGGHATPEPIAPHDAALARLAARKLRDLAAGGAGIAGFTVVPGTTEIGYAIRGDAAELVATRSIEVDFGGGYRKLYRLEAPLFG